MADKIIQSDLEGREHLTPRQERFGAIREITRGLTIFTTCWVGMLLSTLIPSIADQQLGWQWALLKWAGLAGAVAASSYRLHLRRWSWLVFAAALAAHGFGLYRCLAYGDVDTEGMGYFALEIILLTALLALHIWWSLLERRMRQEELR